MQEATLGGGCFWCIEAVLRELPGVLEVTPGLAGAEPAEVVRVRYDPARLTFAALLEVFFRVHDPTTRDRQGDDVGREYRSVIFYHDEAQRAVAADVLRALGASGAYADPVVTELTPLTDWKDVADKHHDYFRKNPEEQYCRLVIAPKIEKFRKAFAVIRRASS